MTGAARGNFLAPRSEGTTMSALLSPAKQVFYPDSDGEPMSDNMTQARWITTLFSGLDGQFRDDPNVLVAMDHLIYPIEGDNRTRAAPDCYVAFGRTKEERGSYRVWEEGGVFPQVVFEVWSPGNRPRDAVTKHRFYERFGAEEYYLIDPTGPCDVAGWLRRGGALEPVEEMRGFVSPRLGVRFEYDEAAIHVFGADGREFLPPREVARQLADAERRAAALAERLRQLGVDPDAP